jgi:hypothetical protein
MNEIFSSEKTLAIIGILVSVFFGIFGIWGVIIVLRRRYQGEITLFIEDSMALFDSIVKNLFPDIAVLYNGEPVSEGLVLLKGTFINSGSIDITENMIKQPLQISLPNDYKWRSAKIIRSSEGFSVAAETNGNMLTFATDSFRCDEYFRFEALVEVPFYDQAKKSQSISRKLIDVLGVKHRIMNAGKVKITQLPPALDKVSISDLFLHLLPLIVLPCLLALGGFLWPRFVGESTIFNSVIVLLTMIMISIFITFPFYGDRKLAKLRRKIGIDKNPQ